LQYLNHSSILCEKNPYLKQLGSYIRLNPFRVGMVETVPALKNTSNALLYHLDPEG
jgi:hypothetical protein